MRVLLGLVALGIWANLLLAPVQAQEGGYIISMLMRIEAQLSRLSYDMNYIKACLSTKAACGGLR